MIGYVIKVKTGDLECAGTDANVFVNIVGSEGMFLLYIINP